MPENATVAQPDTEDPKEKLWPDWVYKHVDRTNPFNSTGVGTAINTDKGRVVLLFTSKDKNIQHFEFDGDLSKALIELHQKAKLRL